MLSEMATNASRYRLSFRCKLVILTLVAILPLFGVAALLMSDALEQSRKMSATNLTGSASVVSLAVVSFVDDSESSLRWVAAQSAVKRGDVVETERLLASGYLAKRSFVNLFVVDLDGHVHSSLFRGAPIDRPYVPGALLTEIMSRDERVFMQVRQPGTAPVPLLAVPITGADGKPSAVLLAELSLRQMEFKLATTAAQSGVQVMVSDADGQLVMLPDAVVGRREDLATLAPVLMSSGKKQGTFEYSDTKSGESLLLAYEPVPRTGWTVVVARPSSAIYEPVRGMFLKGAVLLLLAVTLGGGVALVGVTRVTRPLCDLLTSVREGLLSANLGEGFGKQSDEFAELSTDFSRVTNELLRFLREEKEPKRIVEHQAPTPETVHNASTKARDEERMRLALEIHDGVAQLAVAAMQQLEMTTLALTPDSRAVTHVRGAQILIGRALDEIDSILRDLPPLELQRLGLEDALRQLARSVERNTGVECQLRVRGTKRLGALNSGLPMVCYRIAQEALNNVAAHASASRVTISLTCGTRWLCLTVSDDGVGFNEARVDAFGEHSGICGMQRRAKSVGGAVLVKSAPGQGTRVAARLPLGSAPASVSAPASHILAEADA